MLEQPSDYRGNGWCAGSLIETGQRAGSPRYLDDAFRAAMQRAINAGEENATTVVSKKPGTRNPKVVLA